MILSYELFENLKNSISKKFVNDIAKTHNYKVVELKPTTNALGAEVKIEFIGDKNESDGLNEYDAFIDDLIKAIGDSNLNEIYTEESGYHFMIYLKNPINEAKEVKQTIFTRNYLETFFKTYGYSLNGYSPNLEEMSIAVSVEGDQSKYDRMLDRMISLHYKDLKEINTIKRGKEMKIFIKDPN